MPLIPIPQSEAAAIFYVIAESIGPLPVPNHKRPIVEHLQNKQLIRPYKDGYILTPTGYDLFLAPYEPH